MGTHLRTSSRKSLALQGQRERPWESIPCGRTQLLPKPYQGKEGTEKGQGTCTLTSHILSSVQCFLLHEPNRRPENKELQKVQPPAAQRKPENGSGRTNGERLGQLSVWPTSFYTRSTAVLFKFIMYPQENSTESPSREITDSLSRSHMTSWKSDALFPELVTVVFHLQFDRF